MTAAELSSSHESCQCSRYFRYHVPAFRLYFRYHVPAFRRHVPAGVSFGGIRILHSLIV